MRYPKLLLLLSFVVVLSCEDLGKKSYLPNSIGAINSIIVVIDISYGNQKSGIRYVSILRLPALD